MKNFSTAVRSAAIATVAAVGLGLGAGAAVAQPQIPGLPAIPGAPAPAAPAAPGIPGLPIPGLGQDAGKGVKQLVTFGDSFTANAGKGGPRGLQPGQTPLVANCATDMENWPKVAGADLNKSVGDWSCNGTGAVPGQLLAYLEAAIQYGDLGPGTEKVVLMYGGMDYVQWIDVAGQLVAKPTTDNAPTIFQSLVKQFSDRVHQVAPGAQLVLASYPEYATDNKLCLFNTPGQVNPIPAPGANEVQGAFRDSIKAAAEKNGAGFIDVYEATRGHGTCNPNDAERYVAGFADPVMGPMTNHPTVAGEHAMGKIIADGLR
nr:GDSL-type esterase/lipase family protein [Corynebacterium lactis]